MRRLLVPVGDEVHRGNGPSTYVRPNPAVRAAGAGALGVVGACRDGGEGRGRRRFTGEHLPSVTRRRFAVVAKRYRPAMTTNASALAAASAAAVLLAVPAPVHAAPGAAQPYRCLGGEVDSRGRSSVDGRSRPGTRSRSSKTLRQVKIKPDDATSCADPEWKDTSSTGKGWNLVYGRWDPSTGTDYLWFNRAYLDDGRSHGSNEGRRRVAVHALGHALGFCHKKTDKLSVRWETYSDIAADGGRLVRLPASGGAGRDGFGDPRLRRPDAGGYGAALRGRVHGPSGGVRGAVGDRLVVDGHLPGARGLGAAW